MDLKSFIRDVPDYPSAGILFRDLTPVMANPQAMRHVTETLCVHLSEKGIQVMSMRNKSNRLEELFVRLVESAKQAG